MSEDAETVARRWFEEVWRQRRRESIEQLMTPDAVGHSPTGDTKGPEQWTRSWERLTGAFGDIAIHIDAVISSGRDVVVRWHGTLTHDGWALGIPASGRAARIQGMTWLAVEKGKIVEGWDGWDSTGLLVAVGAASLHPEVVRAMTAATDAGSTEGHVSG
jgi:steroid delta-isomerase-like uncharacterized protein